MTIPENPEEPAGAEGWSYAAEVAAASATFYEASRDKPLLKTLFLINPVRAMADAGIELSRTARKRIRHAYPDMAWDDPELYDQVASGELELDFIVDVQLGRPRSADEIRRLLAGRREEDES